MQLAVHDGVRLAYRTYGSSEGPALVVLNGVGSATRFDEDALTHALVEEGFHVIRMDNRDSGLSSTINPSESLRDEQPAYRLEDMTSDVNTVLQSAQIPSAHIMGISLGGMIGQVFASKYPDKTLSLISVSSTTGKSGLKLGPAMTYLQEPPAPTRELRVRQFIKLYQHFAGKRYPMTQQEMEHRARADLSNDDPLAAARQGMAAGVSGDRTPLLSALTLPTLVIHGSADEMFPLPHGQATADAIPGAELVGIDGMGHAISDAAAQSVAQAVSSFIRPLTSQ